MQVEQNYLLECSCRGKWQNRWENPCFSRKTYFFHGSATLNITKIIEIIQIFVISLMLLLAFLFCAVQIAEWELDRVCTGCVNQSITFNLARHTRNMTDSLRTKHNHTAGFIGVTLLSTNLIQFTFRW